MNKVKFETLEKVRVYTKFYDYQDYFWLPGEVLYFWECFPEKDYSVIEWHGTAHKVPTKDIYKLENADETI